MGKEKSQDPEREARKAEKRARKESKRSETDGVHKSKKESKAKDKIISTDVEKLQKTTKLLRAVEGDAPGSILIKEDDDTKILVNLTAPLGALVPFARPLAEEKIAKKIFKSVKKGRTAPHFQGASLTTIVAAQKHNTLKRGVKECVKALRKSSIPPPSSSATPNFICILAGDISPMDVISHLPVLCEDHGVPYIFVTSRAELGSAGATQRPTSVVLISHENGKKRKKKDKKGGDKEDDGEKSEKEGEWGDIYDELLKIVVKASRDVKI